MTDIINKLIFERNLSRDEFIYLYNNASEIDKDIISKKAREISLGIFSNKIYIRGLIEITNYCQNDCYYCGIRKSNFDASRYSLDKADILACCEVGYDIGFRTFVMQGGELGGKSDNEIIDIVSSIRERFSDCAITLSLGEKTKATYKDFFNAGANRYLLRHETANNEHYARLHPLSMSLDNRKRCLFDLAEIGYQVGTGFMVGSPFQTTENIAEDMEFIKALNPQMIGIGPFIPHKDTPFGKFPAGNADDTCFLISILRLMMPYALIPATTSLGTISKNGREKGILGGANVIMPNLSPINVREKYTLYDNKLCTGNEASENLRSLNESLKSIGYEISYSRGDYNNG